MKKAMALLGIFLILAPAFAEELPGAGMTPNRFFYFMETFGERVRMAFTFNREKKAELAFQYAQERLSEAKEMAERNMTQYSERLMERYSERMNESVRHMELAQSMGANATRLQERVANATGRHLEVLQRVYESAPVQAKEAIQNAMQNSIQAYNRTMTRLMQQTGTQNMQQLNVSDNAPEAIRQAAAQIRNSMGN